MSMTLCVRGNVLVSNRTKGSEEMGFNGMPLDPNDEYLIATDAISNAEVEIDGSVVRLLEGKMLFLKDGKWVLLSHHETKFTKQVIGWLWSHVPGQGARDEAVWRREEQGNSVIGVRG